MKRIIVLLVIILAWYGCKKENPVTYSSSLIGEWSWIRSCGGFSGGCWTPQSASERINLVFTPDSIYNVYQADTLISSTRFHVYKLTYADNKDTTNVITYGSWSATFSIADDILSLNNIGADFGSDYKRVIP